MVIRIPIKRVPVIEKTTNKMSGWFRYGIQIGFGWLGLPVLLSGKHVFSDKRYGSITLSDKNGEFYAIDAGSKDKKSGWVKFMEDGHVKIKQS